VTHSETYIVSQCVVCCRYIVVSQCIAGVLYGITVCCRYIVLYHNVLQVYCIVLKIHDETHNETCIAGILYHRSPAFYHMLTYFAVCCSVLQRVAESCSVLQCVAEAQTRMMQCVAGMLYHSSPALYHMLSHFAVCCSVLQYVAVCCSVL